MKRGSCKWNGEILGTPSRGWGGRWKVNVTKVQSIHEHNFQRVSLKFWDIAECEGVKERERKSKIESTTDLANTKWILGPGEVAWQVIQLATKLTDLIIRTHMVEGKNQILQATYVIPSYLCIHRLTHVPMHANKQTNKIPAREDRVNKTMHSSISFKSMWAWTMTYEPWDMIKT